MGSGIPGTIDTIENAWVSADAHPRENNLDTGIFTRVLFAANITIGTTGGSVQGSSRK